MAEAVNLIWGWQNHQTWLVIRFTQF